MTPSRGVEDRRRGARSRKGRLDSGAVDRVVHATTLFTNTLIERKGARTGLITTRGFRDTLEIGRERKYELYDLTIAKATPARAARPAARGDGTDGGEPGRCWSRSTRRSLDEAMSELARFASRCGRNLFPPRLCQSGARTRGAGSSSRDGSPACAFAISSEVAPEIREFERILDHCRQRLL